ncbi:MAG: AhpC/TSA family protein [Flavobacteriales bacterium]|nr:AhpC/TSA family protein [Flavobacteriales bacterium]
MKLPLIIIALFVSIFSFSQEEMYDICPIKNSEEVPSSIIYDVKGGKVDLKDYISDRPAVVVFYRGGWCPYCTRHLSALQESKSEINELGFELIAITPDNFNKLDSSIVRGDVDFTLFSDKDADAINKFGIGWEINDELYAKYKNDYKMDVEWWSGESHHILPVPAVFVIKNGKIQFQHVDPNYSKRLSASILLAYLNSID